MRLRRTEWVSMNLEGSRNPQGNASIQRDVYTEMALAWPVEARIAKRRKSVLNMGAAQQKTVDALPRKTPTVSGLSIVRMMVIVSQSMGGAALEETRTVVVLRCAPNPAAAKQRAVSA